MRHNVFALVVVISGVLFTTGSVLAQIDSRKLISRKDAEQLLRIPENRTLIEKDPEWPRKTCADADIGVAWRAGCVDQCVEANVRKLADEWKVDYGTAAKRIEPEYSSLHAHCASLCVDRCEGSFRALRDQMLADLTK